MTEPKFYKMSKVDQLIWKVHKLTLIGKHISLREGFTFLTKREQHIILRKARWEIFKNRLLFKITDEHKYAVVHNDWVRLLHDFTTSKTKYIKEESNK